MVLTDPDSDEQLTVRRITVELIAPTRDGDTELHLVSNVPVEDADALKLGDLYHKRWTIETVFQEITTTLGCEISTLGYPPAALFAFCLALLAYNAVAILKASLRAVHGAKFVQEEISGYYSNLEISQATDGMMVAIPEELWEPLHNLSAVEMAGWLKERAARVDCSRYKKHRRGPKKNQPDRQKYHNGGHASTAKFLRRRKEPEPAP